MISISRLLCDTISPGDSLRYGEKSAYPGEIKPAQVPRPVVVWNCTRQCNLSCIHCYASADARRHYLICQRCHRLTEFPCNGLDGLIEDVRQQTAYTITDHLLELSGLCPDCQPELGAGESS